MVKTKKEILTTECDADNLTILIKGFSDFDSLMVYYKNVIMNKPLTVNKKEDDGLPPTDESVGIRPTIL